MWMRVSKKPGANFCRRPAALRHGVRRSPNARSEDLATCRTPPTFCSEPRWSGRTERRCKNSPMRSEWPSAPKISECGANSGGGRREFVELLAEARAVSGLHGDDLYTHAVIFADATNDGAAANLSNRHVEDDLHEAAEGDLFLCENVQAAQSHIFHVVDVALRAGLPSDNHTFGRLDARVLSLLLILHYQVQGGDYWVRAVYRRERKM